MYGSRSSIRWKSTEAYAVAASKCDGSILRTVPHAGSPRTFDVTFVQCLPASRVSQIRPSFVPAQISPRWIFDGAMSNTTSP